MFPSYAYSEIRYRQELDPNYKGEQEEEEEENENKDGQKVQAKKFTSEKDEEENQAKQKLERRKKEIKKINNFMRFMQNNIADRKTQNYVFQVEEKILVDDFLNKHEFEEMQRNYNDFNLGDLVLIFFNPDREDKDKCFGKTPYVKFIEAETIYDNYLKVLSDNGQTSADLISERKAFLYSFLMLDDYIEKVDPEKQKQKEKQIEEERQRQKLKMEQMKQKNGKKDKTNQNEGDSKANDEEKQIANRKEKKRDKTKWDLYLEEFQKLKFARLSQEGEFNGFNLIEEQYLTDLLMEVPLNEKIQFKDVKKKLYGGGFLSKYSDDPLYQTEWLCSNDQPRDFLTLVRFTIQSKLTSKNSNFHTRCFISEFGEDIFMVLKGNEKDFDKEAMNSGITKQLELGYSDLFSLEPCDIRYRPLRLKKQIQSCVNEIMKDKHFTIKEEEPTIKRAQTLRNFRRIEDRTKMLFDVVKKWNNNLFWTNLALKQIKVNKFMDDLAEKLNINRDNEKAEILDDDDENTSREEWEAYYVYLDYLMYFQKKMLELHQIAKNDQKEKLLRKYDLITQNEAFLYKLIFRKALGDTNEVFHLINGSLSKAKVLQNIWDRLGTRPISAFLDYFNTTKEKGQFIWRRYEVNEKKNRSKYLNMERIKLTYSMVVKQINLEGLVKSKMYLKTFMAIHDPYQLKGNAKAPMFKKLIQATIVDDDVVTETEKELRKFFKLLEDEAEGADFDAESVAKENELDIKRPWVLQIDSIRDYFGEKLALYFKFVQFFTFHLSYLAFIGIIIFILKVIIISDVIEFYLNTLFACFIILWSTLFVEFWKRQQILFTIEFGQQKFEEDEAERPEFIGVYQRSIENDKMNEKYFSPVKRRMIMLGGLVGSFFIIFLVVLTMYNIFNLRQEWTTNPPPFIGSNAILATNVMNSVQIVVFTQIYNVFANFLNKIENHKILSSYENSYIAKLFLFQFFNTFNSLILISFFNSIPPFSSLNLCASQVVQTTVVDGKTVKKTVPGEINCFSVLQSNIITIFLTMIIKTILEVVIPFATQKAMELLKKKLLSRGEMHPFTKIDKEIENQSLLKPYMTNDDLDGTVQDYLQLIVKFSFLTLFGLSFPPTFAIAFGNNIIQLQVDKIKLIYLYQRPIPKGASNIGTWLVILQTISFIATFGNAGLIIYTSKYRDYLSGNEPLITFVSLLILFLIPDVPEKALIISKRNQVAVERINKGFKKDISRQVTVSNLNFNTQGIKYKKNE